MSEQQHVIFGTGLIGGYLAGVFLSQSLSTSVVGRTDKLSAFKDGLKITDFLGHTLKVTDVPVHRSTQIDVLWLTVKCTAVLNCIPEIRKILHSDTLIICCQNGFGSDQALRETFPNNTVLNAVVGFNVAEQAVGHLHRSTDGKLIVEQHPSVEQPLEQINCPALPVQSTTDILGERWAKLQLNLANPVNALADIPVKAMTEDAGYRKIIVQLMQEMFQVTDALNVELPKVTAVPAKVIPKILRLPNWIFLRLAQKMLAIDPTARTSMWWDLKQGRQTEIDYINGAVVTQAERLGLACPVNARLISLIKDVENGHQTTGISAATLRTLIADE